MSKLIRRWARDGRMERRAVIVGGGTAAEVLIRSVEKQPYNDIRICGIFDDRGDKRSPPIVAGYPKLGTDFRAHRVRPHRPYRHADRVAAADRRIARPAAFEEAVGAAGRHPALGAFERAAVPAARLFLHRLGADARHLRQADQRLGFGRQARLRHRLLDHRHHRVLAGHAGDRDRHQARQQGTGAVPPEAAWLQQRDHRGLQVPFDVHRQGRTRPPSRR